MPPQVEVGINPHFDLWQHLFAVHLLKKRVGVPVGCAGIHFRNNRADAYPSMRLSTSNKGWHSQWFYVKDDAATPLPVFSECVIKEALGSWRWGVLVKEKKNINDLLAALQTLKDRGVKGSGIIGAYHVRRVAPLVARMLPLHQMVPGASLEGTVLVDEALPPSEVVQHIKEAKEPSKDTTGVVLDFLFPVSGHPPMRPEPGFIDFVSFLSPYSFLLEFPTP